MQKFVTQLPRRCPPWASLRQTYSLRSAHAKATDQSAPSTKPAQGNARPGDEHADDLQRAQKETQSRRTAQENREQVNAQTSEYSKSGGDNAVAAMKTVSFGRVESKHAEDLKDELSQRSPENPLEVSPANTNISEPASETESGVDHSKTTVRTYMGESNRKSKSSDLSKEKQSSGFDRRKKEESTTTFKPGSR